MPRYDIRTPRLHVDVPIAGNVPITLDSGQANYLQNVLRLRDGDPVLLFNGQDGEWRATLEGRGRRATVTPATLIRPQTHPLDLHYLFAPLKHARLDYVVQKAVEMGVSLLAPVITRHTQTTRLNLDRMRANAIEAAEQCGILNVPEVEPPRSLEQTLAMRDPGRLLVFCDEDAEGTDPLTALTGERNQRGTRPMAVLIGPEGGFAENERETVLRQPHVVRLALGPRILRADTVAVAALALVQSVLGDWR